MTHRTQLPRKLRRIYNIGVVVCATIGLIMAFLLTLERYDAPGASASHTLAAHAFP
jgi:hypothetical protein